MGPRSFLRSLSLPIRTSAESENKVNTPQTIYSLDEEESEDKLTELKKIVKCLNLPSGIDDDYFYLKWLRARGYNLEKAKEMLTKHLEWRESCTYLHGVMNYIPPQDLLDQIKWKRLGNDADGRPVYCFRVGRADIRYLLANNYFEDFKRYGHKMLEILQGESDEQRRLTGYGKAIAIIDMTDFTFAKAMSVELLQLGIYFARVFEANYPESLYRGFILNTSWFFTSLYNALKPFVSYETISKVQIYGTDQSKYLPALLTTVPIELIPEEFGGTGESIEYFEDIA